MEAGSSSTFLVWTPPPKPIKKVTVNRLLDGVWKTLECPICLEIALPPIVQCRQGHHICKNCKIRVTHCGICRDPISPTRNFVAESLVLSIPLPCRYRENGCMVTVLHDEKLKHEKTCSNRPFICPFKNCKASVVGSKMLKHFKSSHKDTKVVSCKRSIDDEEFFSGFTFGTDQKFILRLIDIPIWGIFSFTVKVKSDKALYAVVQMVASEDECRKFRYTCTMYGIEDRNMSYSGPVYSLHVPLSDIRSDTDCLIISGHFMEKFNSVCSETLPNTNDYFMSIRIMKVM